MKNEEHAHRNELESLKVNMARIASLLVLTIYEILARAFTRRLAKIGRWSLLLLFLKSNCLHWIMSAKLFWLCHVSTYFNLVRILTHNATRFSLLNSPFFLIISCILLILTQAHLTNHCAKNNWPNFDIPSINKN